MMYTIINKYTGQVLFCKFDNEVLEDQMAITALLTVDMINPYWDFENEIFYDKVD